MSTATSIEWTDATWNPVTGCTKVSPGCEHCYIERQAPLRMAGRGFDRHGIGATTGVVLHPERLDMPARWRKPRRVFVCSMADLFHDDVPDGFIARVFTAMAMAPQHTFQVLTKRPARMRSFLTRWYDNTGDAEVDARSRGALPPMPRGPEAVRATYPSPRAALFADMLDSMGTPPEGAAYPLYDWAEGQMWWPTWPLPNVWLGVSTENQQWANARIPVLLDTPAAVRWISAEPLLGLIHLATAGGIPTPLPVTGDVDTAPTLDWVVVGGESGPGSRPMNPLWARILRGQCHSAGIPFLFKQWGNWVPAPWRTDRDATDGATHAFTGGFWCDEHGYWVEDFMALDHKLRPTERDLTEPEGATGMRRVAKKIAGRELDGVVHNEFPGESTVAESRAERLARIEHVVVPAMLAQRLGPPQVTLAGTPPLVEDIEWLLEQVPEEWPCPSPDDPAGCYCPTRSEQHLEGVATVLVWPVDRDGDVGALQPGATT